jgi:hypothetical protein
VQQSKCQAIAAHADWVSESDCSTVDVDNVIRDTKFSSMRCLLQQKLR